MKKEIVLFLSLLVSIQLFSQMTFIFKNGDKIAVKDYTLSLKTDTVQYFTQDGKTNKVLKTDVFCILYKKMIIVYNNNGFPIAEKVRKGIPEMNPKDSCSMGIVDAIKNYKPGGAGLGTGIVSFVAWPVGLITAIVVSSVPPAKSHLHMPEAKANDQAYTSCYRKQAHKKKQHTTWAGWGFGTTMGCLLTSLLILL